MPTEDGPDRLTAAERAKVISLGVGFLIVLSFLVYLSIRFDFHTPLLRDAEDLFRKGQLRRSAATVSLFLFYLVGVPAGVIFSTIAIYQGARGRPTRLTRWFLKESSHAGARQSLEEKLDRAEARGQITSAGRAMHAYLPAKVGWIIFLIFILAGIGLLVWSATKD